MTILNAYLEGQVDRASNYPPGSHRRLRMTGNQSVAYAKYEPDYAGLAEGGRIYCAQPGVVANAVASVTDTPTTGAHFALYNGAAATSKTHLLILGVSYFVGSGSPGIGSVLLGGVSGGAQAAAVTTTAGNLLVSTSGSARATVATYDSTLTLTTQPAWMALVSTTHTAAAALGQGGANFDLKGMFLVPRTFCFALAVVTATGSTPLFLASVVYAEVDIEPYVS